ncbi:hypothetical protein AVEN_30194-1 [Araneus ventricosus]|uniref:Uncharacterized protein n=1 Tax=Araneus ventricosus TaxID=182803 RepID=A0A4Y2DSI7_ARAVE|nr:hypothetical protein AVEN_30194-1 [Araneus ventricosus]
MHTLTKFLVHTANVQCVRPWSPGTHPSGNPVPSRRSKACFRRCPSQQKRCVPAVLAALLALGVHKNVLHITPQEEITWREVCRPGGPWEQRNIIQTSTPYPVMWQFFVQKVADNCAPVRWCPIDLESWGVYVSSVFIGSIPLNIQCFETL